jgi:hypothetical protein
LADVVAEGDRSTDMTITLSVALVMAAVFVFSIVLVARIALVALRNGADADGEIHWGPFRVRLSIRRRT